MELLSQIRWVSLQTELDLIHLQTQDPVQYSEKAVHTVLNKLNELKTVILKRNSLKKKDEIFFFKNIKPLFTSKFIYYNEIYSIETSLPIGSTKTCQKHYNAQLTKINLFFEENREFYRYYKTGNTLLDHKYFRRGNYDMKVATDNLYVLSDNNFSTSHDFKVARILANESLKIYVENKLHHLKNTASANNTSKVEHPLKWTGSKVGIIELIYALHTEGVFNYGNAELKNIIRCFEKSFELDLGQFHRTFSEITARKSNRTKFLQTLQENLVRLMEDKDKI